MSWNVTIDRVWSDAARRWRPFFERPQATPFQSERWLARWYRTLAARPDVQPLLITVTDRHGVPALALPLILHYGRLRSIEFADRNVTDYNAPLLGPAAPGTKAEAEAMWAAIRGALPPADLLEFSKMPLTLLGRSNPLTDALATHGSNLAGSFVRIEGSWSEWLGGYDKSFRKEMERRWRVFTRDEGARFVIARGADEARALYEQLEIQQGSRIRELGLPYNLDQPEYRDFYRDLVLEGLQDGSVILSALMAGDQLVASLLSIRRGDHLAMVRISAALSGWAACSPGRLVIERTMAAEHERGVRVFDFTTGDYSHKRLFHPEAYPLADYCEGLSWRAWPSVSYAGAKAYVKERPVLERLIRSLIKRAA